MLQRWVTLVGQGGLMSRGSRSFSSGEVEEHAQVVAFWEAFTHAMEVRRRTKY